MKNILKTSAVMLNVGVLVAMTAIGAYNIKEAHARENVNTISEEDRHCLRQNIFFESRHHSDLGQFAVAWVTLNRVESERYPDTICEVVKQARLDDNGNPIRHQCQFSWFCDGKSDEIPENVIEQRAWEHTETIVEEVLYAWFGGEYSPVENATMYHADYVDPYWSSDYDRVVKIDEHIFYR